MGAVVTGNELGTIVGFNHEVVAVDVVDVAVVVVVDSGSSVGLGLVDPHVAGKVFVLILRSGVADGYYHVAGAGGDLPGGEKVDVGAGYRAALGSGIVEVPLLPEVRVVEASGSGLGRHHIGDAGDSGSGGQVAGRLGQREFGGEADVVPAVQAGFAVAGVEPAALGQ